MPPKGVDSKESFFGLNTSLSTCFFNRRNAPGDCQVHIVVQDWTFCFLCVFVLVSNKSNRLLGLEHSHRHTASPNDSGRMQCRSPQGPLNSLDMASLVLCASQDTQRKNFDLASCQAQTYKWAVTIYGVLSTLSLPLSLVCVFVRSCSFSLSLALAPAFSLSRSFSLFLSLFLSFPLWHLTHARTHRHAHTHTNTHTHTHTHTQPQTQRHTQAHSHVMFTHIHTYGHTHTRAHAHR